MVSIPYRYATNFALLSLYYLGKLVSIPYRYATNEKVVFLTKKEILVSIPYRYATNKKYGWDKLWEEGGFNPL